MPTGTSARFQYRSCGRPMQNYIPDFDLATYREFDGEPRHYELEWFS